MAAAAWAAAVVTPSPRIQSRCGCTSRTSRRAARPPASSRQSGRTVADFAFRNQGKPPGAAARASGPGIATTFDSTTRGVGQRSTRASPTVIPMPDPA